METYTFLRQFADSWVLLLMVLFFIGAILFVFFRPGSRKKAEDASRIPFKDDD
ncbi:cbb3-type cytochrome c oxidase subunit 3 [Aquamicrobium segne]|uniref:Cbb3-type cytochrome c oxidase subunit 3 n=1 Tax=Aquamicrobium segne TaxID=469547 RepID=A0ABW0GXI7_9HYPH